MDEKIKKKIGKLEEDIGTDRDGCFSTPHIKKYLDIPSLSSIVPYQFTFFWKFQFGPVCQ